MSEAILATFADCKIIRTRSCIQIICEVPIEDADEALRMLGGIPQPGTERWVGIALAPKERKNIKGPVTQLVESGQPPRGSCGPILDDHESAGSSPARAAKSHRPFASLKLSNQAGMRCEDGQFRDFISEMHGLTCMVGGNFTTHGAVRQLCGVSSRSELDTNNIAGAKWKKLEEDYQAYLTDQRYSGQIK